MTDASYGITKNLGQVAFDTVLEKVAGVLKAEGFGVLTEIDVKATLKQKIDVDFRQYRILGACNPSLAHRAMSAELLLGLLLPCNVVVFEEDDGSITVSAVKPAEMFKVVENPELEAIGAEVEARLRRALDALG